MLEQYTFNQAVAFFLSAVGIAVLLQRVPHWDAVPANLKKLIVLALNLLAPGALAAIHAYVPPAVGDQTIAQLIIGVFMAAAAFVVHLVDEWLEAKKKLAKLSV